MESESDDESSFSDSLKQLEELTDVVPSKTKATLKPTIPSRRPARQLWLHAALMCGRDFLYSIEVVLVTPIMLQLGMPEYLYSYIWFISPTFGLLLGPLIGNWSDKCTLRWGRRRPFILSFVIGTVIGLTLMILSKDLASAFSSFPKEQRTLGLIFGIVGTQIMDFCLDQLEAPLRAYTLDVCSPADQQRAFALQSLAMGTGAALGFIIDGIKWNEIFGTDGQGIQVKIVYAFGMIVYFLVTVMTLSSIKEAQWKRPTKRATLIEGTGTVDSTLAQNSTDHCVKTRGVSSEPIITKQKLPNLFDNNNSTIVQAIKVPHMTLESDTSKVILNSHATSTPETRRSAAVRSITVLPRVSLCKSVFMAMSCPEGLNDTDTSESNVTTASLASGNDESSFDGDQDSNIFGQSLPNLSQSVSPQTKHVTNLDSLKSTFSSSTGNVARTVSNVGSPKLQESPRRSIEASEYSQTNATERSTQTESNRQSGIVKPCEKNIPFHRTYASQHLCDISSGKAGLHNHGAARRIEFEEKPLLNEKSHAVAIKPRRKKKIDNGEADEGEVKPVSTRLLWLSIITMPSKFRFLCLSLLISFMGIEIELLWYTNIFGRVVYGGDPTAPPNSTELQLYNDGVHMGCWGLTIYAVAVMLFSIAMEHFNILTKVSTRLLYAGGQFVTAFSTMVMFLFPKQLVFLLLSWTFGITVSTSLIVPYILVGKYHTEKEFVMKSPGATRRGYGTDCAILACQMYAGNLLYAAVSGPTIYSYGGVKIMLAVASICHILAFVICMWFVTYPGERSYKFCNAKPRTTGDVDSPEI